MKVEIMSNRSTKWETIARAKAQINHTPASGKVRLIATIYKEDKAA